MTERHSHGTMRYERTTLVVRAADPARNGLPGRAYAWRPGDAVRDAEVEARLAAARARARWSAQAWQASG